MSEAEHSFRNELEVEANVVSAQARVQTADHTGVSGQAEDMLRGVGNEQRFTRSGETSRSEAA